MSITEQVGTPSEANTIIGGVPIVRNPYIDIIQLADWVLDGHLLTPLQIHYFDFQSRGRGQVIRLLLEDAGIAYTDVRYSFGEFIEGKDTHPMLSRNPTKSVPIIELGPRLLTQSYPILRHVARLLGEYDGKTEEEKFHADLICDIAADCKSSPIIHGWSGGVCGVETPIFG